MTGHVRCTRAFGCSGGVVEADDQEAESAPAAQRKLRRLPLFGASRGEGGASITIRNVPDEVHRAVRVRAPLRGRSAEAEIREILETAVKPQGRVKLGSLLTEIGRMVTQRSARPASRAGRVQ